MSLKSFVSTLFMFFAFNVYAENVGYMSGSFDPPSRAHFEIMRSAIINYKLDKLFVSVNRYGGKDFNASLKERIDFMQVLQSEFPEKVVVFPEAVCTEPRSTDALPEWITTRLASLDKLHNHYKTPVYNFIGEDSFKYFESYIKSPKYIWIVAPREDGDAKPGTTYKETEFVKTFHLSTSQQEKIQNVSSSLFRKQVLNNPAQAAQLLDADVFILVQQTSAYWSVTPTVLAKRKLKFTDAFAQFKNAVSSPETSKQLEHCNVAQIQSFPAPDFNPTQSELAWKDKLVRWFVEAAGQNCPLHSELLYASFSSLAQ